MAFDVTLEMSGAIAKITLSGELDAATAHSFRDVIQQAADQQAQRLVLLMEGLEYMASAGLRVLIFAKQTMGTGVDLYIVGAQDMILETIEMTGFHHGVTLLDAYDASVIEDF